MKKNFSVLLMMVTMVLFTGCGSDDDGGSGNNGGPYIGEWVKVTNMDENDFYVEVLKLNSNGTGTETVYHLSFYESIYESQNFTYSVSGNQITVNNSEGTYTGNYSLGTTSGYRSLTITLSGKTTLYLEMTPEVRDDINAFKPTPGNVH